MKTAILAALFAVLAAGAAFAQGAPSTPGATVYFANLSDGDTVSSPAKDRLRFVGHGRSAGPVSKRKAPAITTC